MPGPLGLIDLAEAKGAGYCSWEDLEFGFEIVTDSRTFVLVRAAPLRGGARIVVLFASSSVSCAAARRCPVFLYFVGVHVYRLQEAESEEERTRWLNAITEVLSRR